jgi:flagellar biosynthesis protein FliQ
MTAAAVVHLARMALEASFWISAPILVAAMAISLVISIVQAMTSLQEPTVSTVPRLAAVGVVTFLLLPWMLEHMMNFTIALFSNFHPFTR